jgi:feruloyl esterase
MHVTTTTGKAIANGFYGSPPKRSYFYGCSTGGRQSLKSAQTQPEDYDGVIAGAAAADFNNLFSWSARFVPINGAPNTPTHVTYVQWLKIHKEVLKQCDHLDGVVDGILEDPDVCNPDFEKVQCKFSGEAGVAESKVNNCLTKTQVNTVNQIYQPLVGKNGEVLFPRMHPGSETFSPLILYYFWEFSYAQVRYLSTQ